MIVPSRKIRTPHLPFSYITITLHFNLCSGALHLMVITGGEVMLQLFLDLLIYHLKHY
jgi:hypothetical protein